MCLWGTPLMQVWCLPMEIVSRHFLRRRARAKVRRLEKNDLAHYRILERTRRASEFAFSGPYRWFVVRHRS
jgi:hypothetical protein